MGKGLVGRWQESQTPQVQVQAAFWQKTGWDPNSLFGKVVLDAGCGCGRFSLISSWYASEVRAIDIDPLAIEATKRDVPGAIVTLDDMLDLKTIEPNSVDLAFAIGTIHHTGNTALAFKNVANCVKPGGQFAVWVYSKPVEDELLLLLDMFHEITSSVPPERLYEIFEKYAVKVRDYYNGAWGPMQQILRVSNSTDNAACVSDTFDWHCPKYRDWYTVEQVSAWFKDCGFKVDRVGDFPVCVRGTKLHFDSLDSVDRPSAGNEVKVSVQPSAKPRPRIRSGSPAAQIIAAASVPPQPAPAQPEPVQPAPAQTAPQVAVTASGPVTAPSGDKPRVLLISDVRNWAFHQNMMDLEEYLSDQLNLTHAFVDEWNRKIAPIPDMRQFDSIYALYHLWGIDKYLPFKKTLGSLRAQWLFPDKMQPPNQGDFNYVNRYRAFNVVSKRNFDEFKVGCPNLWYLTNPVNMRRFSEPTSVTGKLVCCWNGNAGHVTKYEKDVKGYRTILQPLFKETKIPFVVAEYSTSRRKPSEMPGFYQQANVSVSASLYEGACVVASTPVIMADGSRKRIDEIVVGDVVIDRNGNRQIVEKHWCDGIPDHVVELVTSGNKKIRVTENHNWPVWSFLKKCSCGCGEDVSPGRLWVYKHSGYHGRTLKSTQVRGANDNTSSAYRAIPVGYEPKQKLRSDEIRKEDFLMIPRKFSVVPTDTTKEEARLLGYYIAEGCVLAGRCGNYGIEFVFSSLEKATWVDDSLRLLKSIGVDASTKLYDSKHTIRVRTTNPRPNWNKRRGDKNPQMDSRATKLAEWVTAHGGKLSHFKRLSTDVMGWPLELKRELLIGMFRGDGTQVWRISKTGNSHSFAVCYDTVSLQLVTQLQLILAQLGYASCISTVKQKECDLTYLGARKKSISSERYHLSVNGYDYAKELAVMVWGAASKHCMYEHKKPRQTDWWSDDDFIYLRVKSIRVVSNTEPVYNMTVGGDHSYLVDNIATYNSNSVMEAMASGLAIVVTDVGNHREMQESQIAEYGDTGIVIVQRSKSDFISALNDLGKDLGRVKAMGEINRAEIIRAWSWDVWAKKYSEFLRVPVE